MVTQESEKTKPKKSKLEIRLIELISNRNQLEKRLSELSIAVKQTEQTLIATIGAIQELEKLK